jgi:hypothetical protein
LNPRSKIKDQKRNRVRKGDMEIAGDREMKSLVEKTISTISPHPHISLSGTPFLSSVPMKAKKGTGWKAGPTGDF